jgi:uncharacterized protein YggE
MMSCRSAQGTIAVSGSGTVTASPDRAYIHLYFKHLAATTEQARHVVSTSVRSALQILAAEQVIDTNIKTVSLSYGIENYYKEGALVYAGQRAEQTVIVTIDDINNNPAKLAAILDKMAGIDTLSTVALAFDIKEKTALFRQSRDLAFQKALDKAEHYARLAGKKLQGIQSITEERRSPLLVQSNTFSASAASSDEGSTNIPTGEQEISTTINVVYTLE